MTKRSGAPTSPPPQATFVVRCWLETLGAEPGFWRGEAREVDSGARSSIQSVEGLIEFMSDRLQRLGGVPLTSTWRRGRLDG